VSVSEAERYRSRLVLLRGEAVEWRGTGLVRPMLFRKAPLPLPSLEVGDMVMVTGDGEEGIESLLAISSEQDCIFLASPGQGRLWINSLVLEVRPRELEETVCFRFVFSRFRRNGKDIGRESKRKQNGS
jgi:hypothetical protein